MKVIDERLKTAFRDEDVAVFVRAAFDIGQCGPDAVPFLDEKLGQTENHHEHRHAWTAAAALLHALRSGSDADPVVNAKLGFWTRRRTSDEPQEIRLREWAKDRLERLVLEGLKQSDLQVEDLESWGGFKRIREEETDRLRQRIDSLPADKKARAVESLQRSVDLWNDPSSTLSELKKSDVLPQDYWVVGSFVAGMTPGLVRDLGMPLSLFMRGMLELAAAGGDAIGLVASLPYMLARVDREDEDEVEDLKTALQVLLDHFPSHRGRVMHWVELVVQLQRVVPDFGAEHAKTIFSAIEDELPEGLAALFTRWSVDRDEDSSSRLVRACEDAFVGEDRWIERSESERLALAVYCLVLRFPSDAAKRWKRFSLDHRIRIGWKAMERWRSDNSEILTTVVRLLKVLLHQQLDRAGAINTARLCHKQLYWILPLISDWNLRGTINKDLATIASRALSRCHDYCERKPAEQETYVQLAYTLFYALPEAELLREIALYARNPVVKGHFSRFSDTKVHAAERYGAFVDSLHADSSLEHGLDTRRLMKELGRSSASRGCKLSDVSVYTLTSLLGIRERWVLVREAGHPESISKSFVKELEREIRSRTTPILASFENVVGEIAHLEDQVAEIGGNAEDTLNAYRRLMDRLRVLEKLCTDHLPKPEREVVGHALTQYIDRERDALQPLAAIIDQEDEAQATEALSAEHRTIRGLVVRWMLDRYMLRELLASRSPLRLFLKPHWVLAWILLPYLFSGLLRTFLGSRGLSDLDWLTGVPFLSVPFVSLLVIFVHIRCKSCLGSEYPGVSLLIPQFIGTLFLGVMQSITADETWSLGFLANPLVRLIRISVFLFGSYFFVRYVMLGRQSPEPTSSAGTAEPRCILRERAMGLLSLGLWQAFGLVTLFMILYGGVMGSATRADLPGAAETLDWLSTLVGDFVPHTIHVGSKDGILAFVLYPWPILSWTVELFFFSAIFERIMSSRQQD